MSELKREAKKPRRIQYIIIHFPSLLLSFQAVLWVDFGQASQPTVTLSGGWADNSGEHSGHRTSDNGKFRHLVWINQYAIVFSRRAALVCNEYNTFNAGSSSWLLPLGILPKMKIGLLIVKWIKDKHLLWEWFTFCKFRKQNVHINSHTRFSLKSYCGIMITVTWLLRT